MRSHLKQCTAARETEKERERERGREAERGFGFYVYLSFVNRLRDSVGAVAAKSDRAEVVSRQ